DALVRAAERLEPRRVDREREARARSSEPQAVLAGGGDGGQQRQAEAESQQNDRSRLHAGTSVAEVSMRFARWIEPPLAAGGSRRMVCGMTVTLSSQGRDESVTRGSHGRGATRERAPDVADVAAKTQSPGSRFLTVASAVALVRMIARRGLSNGAADS